MLSQTMDFGPLTTYFGLLTIHMTVIKAYSSTNIRSLIMPSDTKMPLRVSRR